MRFLIGALLILLLFSPPVWSQHEIAHQILGSGGFGAELPGLEIRSTLGQPVIGIASGAQHEIRSGFWYLLPQVPTDVDARPTLRTVFALHGSAPNPSGSQAIIRYSVADGGGPVLIRLFDVTGRLVKTLVDRIETAGLKSVAWNGHDRRGSEVATGIYFVSMDAPGFKASRKLAVRH